MAKLAAVVNDLESVPEAHRDLYTQNANGAFELNLDGTPKGFVPTAEKDEFRQNNRDLKAQLDEATEALKGFDGIDATKAKELLATQEELDTAQLIKAGDLEGLVDKAVEKAAGPLNDQIGVLTEERDEAQRVADNAVVDTNVLRHAADVGKVRKGAADTLVLAAKNAGWKNVGGQLLQVDGDGTVRGRDFPGWLGEQTAAGADLAFCFEPSTGGGGGGADGDGGADAAENLLRRKAQSRKRNG